MEELELENYDNDFINLEAMESTLNVLYDQVLEVGVCKGTIEILNYLTEENNVNYPIASFTDSPSEINVEITLESIVDSILKGIGKVIKYIFKMLSVFFEKISNLFKWLGGKDDRDVNTKEEAIIKAMVTGDKEINNKEIVFKNNINNKPVSGVFTEKLLEMAYKDNESNKYKNVKDILEEFFKGGIDEVTWENFVKNNNNQLKHMCEYILLWWNSSNPLVVSHENVVEIFVKDVIEAVNIVSETISSRINLYVEEIKSISGLRKEQFDERLETFNLKLKISINDINTRIKEQTNAIFSICSFIKIETSDNIKEMLIDFTNEYKEAKVSQKTKIDLVNSLKEIQWVKEIKGLDKKIEAGNKKLAVSEKTLAEVVKNIKAKFFKTNKKIADELNKLLNRMKQEIQTLMSINASYLNMLLITQKNIELNRKKSSTLHELLIAVGVKLEKQNKE